MKFKDMLESIEPENIDMAKDFVKNVEKEFKKHFPNGGIESKIDDMTINIEFGIDPTFVELDDNSVFHRIIIGVESYLNKDFGTDTLYFNTYQGYIYINPSSGGGGVELIKTKLSNVKKGSLSKFEKKMKSWFPKLKKLVKEHQDNLTKPIDKKYKV